MFFMLWPEEISRCVCVCVGLLPFSVGDVPIYIDTLYRQAGLEPTNSANQLYLCVCECVCVCVCVSVYVCGVCVCGVALLIN